MSVCKEVTFKLLLIEARTHRRNNKYFIIFKVIKLYKYQSYFHRIIENYYSMRCNNSVRHMLYSYYINSIYMQ